MSEHSTKELIRLMADREVAILTCEALEEYAQVIVKDWFTPDPKGWSDYNLPTKCLIVLLTVPWTCFVLYVVMLNWFGTLAFCVMQDVVTDFDPSAQRTIPCLTDAVNNAIPVAT